MKRRASPNRYVLDYPVCPPTPSPISAKAARGSRCTLVEAIANQSRIHTVTTRIFFSPIRPVQQLSKLSQLLFHDSARKRHCPSREPGPQLSLSSPTIPTSIAMLASRRTFATAPSLRLCGGRSIAAPLLRAYSTDTASWPKPTETAKSTDTASWPKTPAAAAPASPPSTPYSSRPRPPLKPRPRPAPRLPAFANKGGPIPKAVFRAPAAASATATQSPPAGAVPPASASATATGSASPPASAPAPATATDSSPPASPFATVTKLPAPANTFQRLKYELPGALKTTPISVQWVPIAPRPQALPPKDPDQDVDWEKSYRGLATNPVTPEQFTILARPIEIEEIEVKPDGIIYMPEIKYRRRLNEVFGPMGWGIVPRGDTVVGKEIVTREYALIVNGWYALS